MNLEKTALLEARNQWLIDIQVYKDFLERGSQTFEGRHGTEQYISMADNRLKDINQKLEIIDSKII